MKHCIIGIFLLSIHATSLAKETIIWRVIDWPPFYILQGNDKGQGIYDVLIDQMITALPEYNHQKVVMNTSRLLAELKNGTHVCSPSALPDTPAALSKVNSFLLPLRLIYHVNDYPKLARMKSISLDNLLNEESFRVGIAANRYPEKINKVIDKHINQENIVLQNNYNSLLRMFFRRRFDALIEYPPVINYSKRMLGLSLENDSIVISELSQTPYNSVHFACPNTAWGKNLISKIDEILIEESKHSNILYHRLRWYEGKDKRELKSYYDAYYMQDK